MYQSESSSQSNKKDDTVIKAFVMTSKDPAGNIAYKSEVVDGVQKYRGLPIEIFYKLMETSRIKDKYTVEYVYSEEGESNYSKVIDEIDAGKYDIAIGVFNRSVSREKQVDFCAPFILDPNAIFHVETDNIISLIQLTMKSVSKLVAILILLGIVAGLVIYFGNPGRVKRLKIKSNRKFFIYSMIAGMASMFGEMGLVADHATRSTKGLLIFFVVMLTAFIFVLIAQAKMTSALVDEKIGSKLTKSNLPRAKMLGLDGYVPTTSVQAAGARIEIIDGASIDDLITLYLKDTSKYGGVAISYCDGFKYLDKYPELFVSLGFGIETGAYPISHSRPELAEAINNGLIELENDGTVQSACISYYGDVEGNPVCSL